jgi:hypothetical protein
MSLSFFSRRAFALLIVVFAFSGFWACTPVAPVVDTKNEITINNKLIKVDSTTATGKEVTNSKYIRFGPNRSVGEDPYAYVAEISFEFNSTGGIQVIDVLNNYSSGVQFQIDGDAQPGTTYNYEKTIDAKGDAVWTVSPTLRAIKLVPDYGYLEYAGDIKFSITIISNTFSKSTNSGTLRYSGRIQGTFSGTLGANTRNRFPAMPISGKFDVAIK